jgi:hypothetical protein
LGLIAPSVKLTALKSPITSAAPVKITVEFVGVHRFVNVPLNIAPPAELP